MKTLEKMSGQVRVTLCLGNLFQDPKFQLEQKFLTGMRSRNHFRSRHFIDELNHLPEDAYQMNDEDFNEYLSQREYLVTESEKLEHRIASSNNNFMDFTTASQLYAGDVHFLEAIVLYVGYILRCSYIYLPFLFLR